jgi:hypothetical protein
MRKVGLPPAPSMLPLSSAAQGHGSEEGHWAEHPPTHRLLPSRPHLTPSYQHCTPAFSLRHL